MPKMIIVNVFIFHRIQKIFNISGVRQIIVFIYDVIYQVLVNFP